MLSHFLPATRADASDLMGMQRLSILHAALYPIGVTAEPANSARCADSQSVNQQMLAHFLPPAYPRSKAFGKHGAPAPCPITREGIRGEGETHTPAEGNTRLIERCNLEEMHATLPTSRPVGTCPHNPYGGLTRMTEM